MKEFYEEYLDALDADELRTIFLCARQSAKKFLAHPVSKEFPPEEARIMSLSLGIALELLRRYQNHEDE